MTINGIQAFTGTLNLSGENLNLSTATNADPGMLGNATAINITNSTLTMSPVDNAFMGGAASTEALAVTLNSGGASHAGRREYLPSGQDSSRRGTRCYPDAANSDGLTYGTYNLVANVTAGGTAATSTISATNVALSQTGGTVFNVSSGAANGVDLDATGTFATPGNGVSNSADQDRQWRHAAGWRK